MKDICRINFMAEICRAYNCLLVVFIVAAVINVRRRMAIITVKAMDVNMNLKLILASRICPPS